MCNLCVALHFASRQLLRDSRDLCPLATSPVPVSSTLRLPCISFRRRIFAELLVPPPGRRGKHTVCKSSAFNFHATHGLTTSLLRFSGCASLGRTQATSLYALAACLPQTAANHPKTVRDGHISAAIPPCGRTHPTIQPQLRVRPSYLRLLTPLHSLWTHDKQTTRSQIKHLLRNTLPKDKILALPTSRPAQTTV